MGKFFSSLFASLNSAARSVISFLLPALKDHAGQLLAAALPIAEGIVVDLAASKMPSSDKRDEAVNQLRSALVAQGYATAADIATRTLNLAVEMAVSKIKSS